MKHTSWVLAIMAGVLSLPAGAQDATRFELGIKGGGGSVGYLDDSSAPARGVIGAELCAWCSGRYALYGEYSHWLPADARNSSYTGSDTFGLGLRIQGTRKIRPFFDIGIAGLNHRITTVFSGRTIHSSETTGGVGFGAGVRIPAGEHLYVRPQVRFYALGGAGPYAGLSAEVGVGWRF